jgi:hypothetical protein
MLWTMLTLADVNTPRNISKSLGGVQAGRTARGVEEREQDDEILLDVQVVELIVQQISRRRQHRNAQQNVQRK